MASEPKFSSFQIKVHVHANASQTKHVLTSDGLEIWLMAPAYRGKANRALIKYLTSVGQLSNRQIRIIRGLHSTTKYLEISNISYDDLIFRLSNRSH